MWKENNRLHFRSCIDDLIATASVQKMSSISQHVNVNCLEHSIFVSYISFLICRFFGLDFVAGARGALLHDLFLYNQHDKSSHDGGHWHTHPRAALVNAQEICSLSAKEKDIIAKHMWPVTFFKFPRYGESVVVNLADKLCASVEGLRLFRLFGIRKNLISALYV